MRVWKRFDVGFYVGPHRDTEANSLEYGKISIEMAVEAVSSEPVSGRDTGNLQGKSPILSDPSLISSSESPIPHIVGDEFPVTGNREPTARGQGIRVIQIREPAGSIRLATQCTGIRHRGRPDDLCSPVVPSATTGRPVIRPLTMFALFSE